MIKKKHQLFLLACILAGILLSSFHYHDNLHASDDCPVCIIQHILTAADIPDPVVLQELIAFVLISLSGLPVYLTSKALHHYPSRAPPSFS